MNMLQSVAEFVADMRSEHTGESIVYQRLNVHASLTATKGKTNHEVDDERGFRTRTDSHDWLIKTGELILDDERTLPAVGDRIIWTDPQGDTQVFEVAPFGNPAIHYRPSDPQQITLRIHTQHVETL